MVIKVASGRVPQKVSHSIDRVRHEITFVISDRVPHNVSHFLYHRVPYMVTDEVLDRVSD